MRSRLDRIAKRMLDAGVAAGGLAALSPLLGAIAIGELVFHGWPPLFVQERPGRDDRIFKMIKFRTMTNERGPDGHLLPDDERMTAFGRWLRATSLDELPELVNVLKGDMSLVGPRPLLVEYLDRYTPTQRRRHAVKPGITGWAQVHGRNSLSWGDKFAMDVWYVDHGSFWLDLKILAATVATVVGRSGIAPEGHATMPKFQGLEDV